MQPVNILRIFAFSLVLGHSNSNNTLFQIVLVFGGHPVYYIVVIIVFTVDDKIGFCLYYIILIAVNIANTMYIFDGICTCNPIKFDQLGPQITCVSLVHRKIVEFWSSNSVLLNSFTGTLFKNVRVWNLEGCCCYAVEEVLSDLTGIILYTLCLLPKKIVKVRLTPNIILVCVIFGSF